MLRSLGTLSLLTLALAGCNQPPDQVSLIGPTDNAPVQNATDATTATPESATVESQQEMEAHGPTLQDAGATTESATRVLQKPVMTQADGDVDGEGHSHADERAFDHAVCVLLAVGDSGVSGTILIDRQGELLHVTGTVKGLSPGKHGFHIHEFGDLRDTQKGMSTGGHFNPTGSDHGHREGDDRHAGDFGNIEAGADGVAMIDFTDKIASINGAHSIIGCGVVVHADEDKFTQPTGAAGGRIAIGVVGIAKPEQAK